MKKGGSRSSRKKKSKKIPLFLLILFFLVTGFTVLILLIFPQIIPFHGGKGPPYEVFRERLPPRYPPRLVPKKKRPPYGLPLVAIIIDDMGYHNRLDRLLLDLDAPLSFSFLPSGPFTKVHANLAWRHKKDILVHIPMEPAEKGVNPGPGALTLKMDAGSILNVLEKDLDSVPHAIGANNHMGSLFTTSTEKMDIVLLEIKKRGLFFIDSRTTKYTVAYKEALRLGIPALERQVFLDYEPKAAVIKEELGRLVRLAKRHGYAIGIGHPYPSTYKVLKMDLPLVQKEVNIVPISYLIEVIKGPEDEIWRKGHKGSSPRTLAKSCPRKGLYH